MTVIKSLFTITYEQSIDSETGEILNTTIVNRTEVKPKKEIQKDSDTEPKVYLEENKLRFNSLALEMLNVSSGDRIDIQYTNTYPVVIIGEGCKLTKTNTLSCRGKKAEVLSKFGTEFKLIDKGNQFALDGGKDIIVSIGNNDVNTEDIDLDLDELLEDTDTTEVKASMFQL